MESTPILSRRNSETEGRNDCCKVTYTLVLLGFCVFLLQYSIRVNMSVAIVAMAEELNWDEPTQGLMLGAFFYGYILTNVVGGRTAELLGGKVVITTSMVATGFLTLLIPVFAVWSIPALVALRVLQGLFQGVTSAAMIFFMTKWVPIEEKAKTGSRIFSGRPFGIFVSLFLGGWMTSYLGWASVFYVTGASSVVFGVIWAALMTDDPRQQKRISEAELNHIVEGSQSQRSEEKQPIPWLDVVKSPSLWLILGNHVGSDICLYMSLSELPTYLVNIQGFSLSMAGTISGIAYLSSFLFTWCYSSAITSLQKRRFIEIRHVRRISAAIGAYGSSLGFLCVILTKTQFPLLAAAVFIFNGTIYGADYSGYFVSHSDIAPRFSGTLYGLTNTFGNIPGFAVPAFVAALTKDNQTVYAWNNAFLSVIVSNVLLSTPYILFFRAEVEPWNDKQPYSERNEEDSEGTQNGSENQPLSVVEPKDSKIK